MVENGHILGDSSFQLRNKTIFTRKGGVDTKIYGQRIEQVKVFRFLGVWFKQ